MMSKLEQEQLRSLLRKAAGPPQDGGEQREEICAPASDVATLLVTSCVRDLERARALHFSGGDWSGAGGRFFH
jgi:hypothetical protein